MMLHYEWRGKPVTEAEFLKLADTVLVDAELIEVSSLLTGRTEKIISKQKVPLYLIENQRFGPGVSGLEMYSYWREIKAAK